MGDNDDQDPMEFRWAQHWCKLQKDPIGLDLDDVLSEDPSKQLASAGTAIVANVSSGTRGSVVSGTSSMSARRISSNGDTSLKPNKRTSAIGSASGSQAGDAEES